VNLFVKSKSISIGDGTIIIEEIGVKYMFLSDEEKQDTKNVLTLHTSLTKEDVDTLTIEAFNYILEEFYKLNQEHFSPKDSGDEDEGK